MPQVGHHHSSLIPQDSRPSPTLTGQTPEHLVSTSIIISSHKDPSSAFFSDLLNRTISPADAPPSQTEGFIIKMDSYLPHSRQSGHSTQIPSSLHHRSSNISHDSGNGNNPHFELFQKNPIDLTSPQPLMMDAKTL